MFEMRKPVKFVGTEEQEAIWKAIKEDECHVLVEALAGTGKTTTNVEGLKKMLGEIAKGKRFGFCAFGRANGQELKQRVPRGVWAGTTHGLGYGILRANLESVELDTDKTWDIITELREEFLEGKWWKKGERPNLRKLTSMLKQQGFRPPTELQPVHKAIMDELCLKYDITWPGDRDVFYEYANEVLKACRLRTHIVDYDDQIWLPYVLDLEGDRFDVLMVDEAQDLNPVQHHLTVQSGERLIVIGDRHQCQPRGTRVLVTGRGYVPIEELRVGDELASYNSAKTYSPGHQSQGRKVELVESHVHSGELIFAALPDGSVTRTTLEHRWLVRLRKDTTDRWAVYLMLIPFGETVVPRIGVTQLGGAGGFGPGVRARQEGAVALWILDTFTDYETARKTEWQLSLLYQISQRATYQNTDNLWAGEIESRLDSARVIRLLESFGRSLEYPMWEKSDGTHVGFYSFMCRGFNLLEHCMEVVRVRDAKDCEWMDLSFHREEYQGEVFSLQVEPVENGRRLYVADGIVTGNSIYGFRGADPDSMQKYEAKLKATKRGLRVLPLSVSWRCPESVIRAAQKLVPAIKAKPEAVGGLVMCCEYQEMYEEVQPGDMVLCRTNMPLVRLLYRLWADSRPAFIQGKDVSDGMLRMIEKYEDYAHENPSLAGLNRWIDVFERTEREKLEARKGSSASIAHLEDKCDCLRVMVDYTESRAGIEGLKRHMEALFQEDGNPEKQIRLSSVHRAKGLEADRVFVLEPGLMPHYLCRLDWEMEQEKNIAYVAITRAKQSLYFVGGLPPLLADTGFRDNYGDEEQADVPGRYRPREKELTAVDSMLGEALERSTGLLAEIESEYEEEDAE